AGPCGGVFGRRAWRSRGACGDRRDHLDRSVFAARHRACAADTRPRAAASSIEMNLDGAIRDGRHVMPVRVYYEDTDFTGIVYHASYLRFMERGRTDYMRLIGAAHRELFEQTADEAPGFAFVVRSMRIDYRKPARMDDV